MSQFNITHDALRHIIRQELLKEAEEPDQAASSASKGDVVTKLKDIIENAGDIPSTQYGAFIAVLDEVLELAMAGSLKAKAKTIMTGLNKFDK